jgi:FMN-dependent NADH-azoreductase
MRPRKLLYVDSSISGAQSVSRRLTGSIVERIQGAIPGLEVVYRDLAAAPIPHISEAVQNERFLAQAKGGGLPAAAAQLYTGDPSRDPQVQRDLKLVDAALDEFLWSDLVVLGAPMYNFGVPSQLKTWIDALAFAGRTFRFTETGAEGLCGGKRVIVASSRGGFYSAGSPMAGLDHQESYLAAFFGFLGVNDVSFVRVEGANVPGVRQGAIDAALAQVSALPLG